eukprot:CAMPEP_0206041466 /NCGR_PEP_ID=MMETSP1466-20131121/5982_1 /ASSEMBLY_ACC=CAM_ASM_001126 /TAXON_ID=44452 /ORGANISM="Pavlova gyrans, Strain CCMP608" /LENGTH=81 /DNA_ID=CAMNT_0053416165 /DNA_START=49 /DNA_END=294 /DNA_ORIENTATION=+
MDLDLGSLSSAMAPTPSTPWESLSDTSSTPSDSCPTSPEVVERHPRPHARSDRPRASVRDLYIFSRSQPRPDSHDARELAI